MKKHWILKHYHIYTIFFFPIWKWEKNDSRWNRRKYRVCEISLLKQPLVSVCKNEQLHVGIIDLQSSVFVGVSARKSAGKMLDFILTPLPSPLLACFMKDLTKLI